MPWFVRERQRCPSKTKQPPTSTRTDEAHPQPPNQSAVTLPLTPPPPYPLQYPPVASSRPLSPPSQGLPQPYSYPPPNNYAAFHFQAPVRPQTAQPRQPVPWKSCSSLSSVVSHPAATVNEHIVKANKYIDNKGTALLEVITDKFDNVLGQMDCDRFSGDEKALIITSQQHIDAVQQADGGVSLRGGGPTVKGAAFQGANQAMTTVITSTNYFAKSNLYANSRLPPNLPPFKVYIPTWPLICLAAQCSQRVYSKPRGMEKNDFVDANWRTGTKAMTVKSVPVDDMNTMVFAIRGTATLMDWCVNLQSRKASPRGFLDDSSNKCHAGFLEVAKKMVRPVAARLRQMLEEDPARSSCTLLLTGHSAGGAIASLLYCHMLSQTVKSELTHLTSFFKRCHCIVFGAPPISARPLSKPANRERQLRKSLFYSFINEGDPVPRADPAYVRSLLELYATSTPKPASRALPAPKAYGGRSKLDLSLKNLASKASKSTMNLAAAAAAARPSTSHGVRPSNVGQPYSNLIWTVPTSTFVNAGRLVVIRVPYGRDGQPNEEDARAYQTMNEDLREIVFGDPLMHQMRLYERRVEIIATKAVTGRLAA